LDQTQAGQRLLEIIKEIAEGHYSDDIMELTRDDVPEPIRTVAEAMGLMMVKVEAREFHLTQLYERIRQGAIATVSAMANALAARNAYTEGHAERVSVLARDTARGLGLNDEETEFVRLGGLLHDIGKIGFSDLLFEDHGQKNPPELVKIILGHPEVGWRVLADLDFLGPALTYVRCHHERLDGSGYPRRIKGEAIPFGALIIAAADGFDAMTTDRPYQKGMDIQTALANLRKQCPHRLDTRVVEALAKVVEAPGFASTSEAIGADQGQA
jgi:HD-GYP domain-containing protein (c-di-GMP phosphodiesterase class II)